MNEREKKLFRILLGALAALALWFGFGFFVSGPLRELDKQIAVAEKTRDEQADKKLNLDIQTKRISIWKSQSLGPEVDTGKRLYQEWLRSLAEICGWSKLEVKLDAPSGQTSVRGSYRDVTIKLTAEASLEQVALFLEHFERVDLLHRVRSLSMESPAYEGNPPLKLTLVAEGLCVPDAERRTTLFSQTDLAQAVDSRATQITVSDTQGFPTVTPFQVRIEQEFLKVTAVNGDKWTVERAVAVTKSASHAAGSHVEMFPQRTVQAPAEVLSAYARFLRPGPFNKLADNGATRFRDVRRQDATRGQEFTLRPEVLNWDRAALGAPDIRVQEDAPGEMTIDERGTLRWRTPRDAGDGPFHVTLTAVATREAALSIETGFDIVVHDPNVAPKLIEVPEQRAYVGRKLTISVKAVDPDAGRTGLTWSLEGSPPSGALINPRTGEFEWTPGPDTPIGDQTVKVTVTDSGSPALSDSIDITVHVADDPAEFTFLVGYLEQGTERTAVLYDRSTNQSLNLTEGATLNLADVEASVITVAPDHVILQVGKDRFRLSEGQNLRQVTPVTDSGT
jgi:hypothetical protein